MDINKLTIGEARELARMFGGAPSQSHSYEVGQAYIIRTVSYHYIGRLERVTDSDLVLTDASWLGDTGRWHSLLATGDWDSSAEIEPYPGEVILHRAVIVDACVWTHPLPRAPK